MAFTGILGTADSKLGNIVLGYVASGAPAITGTGAVAAQPAAVAATGTYTPLAITGTGAVTTQPVALAGTGTYTPIAITGTGAVAAQLAAIVGAGAQYPLWLTAAQVEDHVALSWG